MRAGFYFLLKKLYFDTMDPLEKYIIENRAHFESPLPKCDLFAEISKRLQESDAAEGAQAAQETKNTDELPKSINDEMPAKELVSPNPGRQLASNRPIFRRQKVSLPLFWRAAASFLILLAASVYFVWNLSGNKENDKFSEENFANQANSALFNELAPELSQAEFYYKQIIAQKFESMQAYPANPELKKNFAQDIAELDSAYLTMRTDLLESNGNEQVIAQMVENLQTRIELLSRQLKILETIKRKQEHVNKGYEL